jgi:hypothetical protein
MNAMLRYSARRPTVSLDFNPLGETNRFTLITKVRRILEGKAPNASKVFLMQYTGVDFSQHYQIVTFYSMMPPDLYP